MLKRLCLGIAIVLGLVAEANGLFMLYSPNDWYFAVPGVTTTGPFNQHFIRDIGLIFLFVGNAFLVGTSRPQFRSRPLGHSNALALEPCGVPFLGSRGRHLRSLRDCTRLPSRNAARDHWNPAHVLGD